jgi:hypothetical protein
MLHQSTAIGQLLLLQSRLHWRLAQWRKHVGAELAKEVARRAVIADVKDGRNVGADIGKAAAGTVDGRAANRGAADPDNLREVTVALEFAVKVGRSCLAVVDEQSHLVVVELVRDDRVDGRHGRTGSNVLAVATTVDFAANKSASRADKTK